jgi:hypothetical protein
VARKSRGKKGCRRRGLIKKLRRFFLKKPLQKSIAASVNVCVCLPLTAWDRESFAFCCRNLQQLGFFFLEFHI